MANSSTTIVLDTTDTLELGTHTTKGPVLQRVGDFLRGLSNGSKRGASVQVFAAGAAPKVAVAHIALASFAAGSAIEINGAPFDAIAGTVTSGNDEIDIDGTNAADATDLARAINASTHTAIAGIVKAVCPANDILTPSSAIANDVFKVTLADGVVHAFYGVDGAVTVGAKTFDIRTSNAATAASITAQVNGYTPFTNKLMAIDGTTVVRFRSLDGNTFTLTGTATTLAESGGATVTVSTLQKGALSNGLTVKTLGVLGTGTVTFSSATGTQTITINGVDVTASAGATDTLTATAVAAAINASTNALVYPFVRATARAAVTHIWSKYPGVRGNTITLAASAAGGSATASVARLAAGTTASSEGAQASGTVTISGADGGNYTVTINGVGTGNVAGTNGDDTATAASIAAAINGLTNDLVIQQVGATSSSGVVTISSIRGGRAGNAITLAATGTGATASGARLTGGAEPTTAVITNSTSASATFGAERTSNGTGGAVTPISFNL